MVGRPFAAPEEEDVPLFPLAAGITALNHQHDTNVNNTMNTDRARSNSPKSHRNRIG